MTDNIQERFEEELHDEVFRWLDQENPTAQGFNVFWDDLRKAIEIQVVDALGGLAPDFLCQVFNGKLSIMYDVPQELHNSITEFYDKYVFEKESKKDLQRKLITNEEARDVLVREKMVWNTSEFAETYISQQEKVTELSILKSRIINEYQRYLVCIDTHDYKLKEVVKNEIFKLLDEKGKLEKELGEMK